MREIKTNHSICHKILGLAAASLTALSGCALDDQGPSDETAEIVENLRLAGYPDT